jgi:erythromycin esterase
MRSIPLRWLGAAFIVAIGAVHPALAQAPADRVRWLKSHAAPIQSVDPGDEDFSDLEPFRRAVGTARVVCLGEQSHGDGRGYSARVRLVKFLHRKMGFDVLAFESGLYDMTKIDAAHATGAAMVDVAPGGLFFMYRKTRQVRPLFTYLDAERGGAHPIRLAGFDSQHTGRLSIEHLFDDLDAFLAANGSPHRVSPEIRATGTRMFESLGYRPEDDAQAQAFLDYTGALLEEIPSFPVREQPLLSSVGFWRRVVESLQSQAQRQFGRIGAGLSAEELDAANLTARDRQMAANLLWLVQEVYPRRKIIVWAHNYHISRSGALYEGRVPMNEIVARKLGNALYVLQVTAAGGSYRNFETGEVRPIAPPPSGSLEDLWSVTGIEYGFLDYRRRSRGDAWLHSPLTWQPLFHRAAPSPLAPSQVTDGHFFIRTEEPSVDAEPPAVSAE